jgi:hypothetical protein
MKLKCNIDYELLAKQRNLLVVTIWQDKESELWGLVNLLDELIDANDEAKAVIWEQDVT